MMLDEFIDSNGFSWLLSWGYCACHVWKVAHVPQKQFAGRCGNCGEGVRFAPIYWTKEDTLDRFRAEYGREPEQF